MNIHSLIDSGKYTKHFGTGESFKNYLIEAEYEDVKELIIVTDLREGDGLYYLARIVNRDDIRFITVYPDRITESYKGNIKDYERILMLSNDWFSQYLRRKVTWK